MRDIVSNALGVGHVEERSLELLGNSRRCGRWEMRELRPAIQSQKNIKEGRREEAFEAVLKTTKPRRTAEARTRSDEKKEGKRRNVWISFEPDVVSPSITTSNTTLSL
jgi:hypothetical protein